MSTEGNNSGIVRPGAVPEHSQQMEQIEQNNAPQVQRQPMPVLTGLEDMIPESTKEEFAKLNQEKESAPEPVKKVTDPIESLEPEENSLSGEEDETRPHDENQSTETDEPNSNTTAPSSEAKDEKKNDAVPETESDPFSFLFEDDKKTVKPELSEEDLSRLNPIFEQSLGEKADDVFKNYKTYKEKSEKYEEIESKYNQIVTGFDSLPEEIVESIRLYESGEDYKQAFSVRPANLDYTKDSKSIADKDLIETYFPGQMTEEDWDSADKESDLYDERAEKLKNQLAEQARSKFENDKNVFSKRQEENQKKHTELIEKFNSSVENSVGSLKKKWPKAKGSYVQDIQKNLGSDGLQKLFFDENGLLKPDAAERFMLARDGDKIIERIRKQALEQGATQGKEEIINRTPEQRLKNGQQQAQHSPLFQRQMKELSELGGSGIF